MKKEVVIVLAEDDEGHATLIKKNLKRAGIINKIVHFKDGQDTINFFLRKGEKPHREKNTHYLLLLDIRMPRVSGVEVLEQIKKDKDLHKMPVTMLTTTDDPKEIDRCHELGCSNYITKPIDYDKFIEAIRQLGLFLLIVQIPKINNN